MPPLTADDLNDIFDYHKPESEQIEHYNAIRLAGREFSEEILRHTPASPDQTAAIRKVREAVMTANAAIALKGKY